MTVVVIGVVDVVDVVRYIKKIKNSPTGIRTPVFHVTGEDTNQLYYWRLLKKGENKVAMGTGRWKKGRGTSDISRIDISRIYSSSWCI